MSYAITNQCEGCDACRPLCPVGAIKISHEKEYWIDPTLCNRCDGYADEPICSNVCDSKIPTIWENKKGRHARLNYPESNIVLFPNHHSQPFASCLVIWEACKVWTQRHHLPWQQQLDGSFCYEYRSRYGTLRYRWRDPAMHCGETIDLRVVCMHLLLATCAPQYGCPWEEEMVINDRLIEEFLGLDHRKDMVRQDKLLLIHSLMEQACQLLVEVEWLQQGRIKSFSLPEEPLWHLTAVQQHLQETATGVRYLAGLTFRVRAGQWAAHFLNKQGCTHQKAFYQYGLLPRSLPSKIMGLWQRHEGAVSMLLYLLFRTRVGQASPFRVFTLCKVAYGEAKLIAAQHRSEVRRHLIQAFEGDLEQLFCYGIIPTFDPETYSTTIQPWWVSISNIPERGEDALEYWIANAQEETTISSTLKWQQLTNARILHFTFPKDWHFTPPSPKKGKRHKSLRKPDPQILTGQMVLEARMKKGMSQRHLADMVGKSQSWIRDVEKGRYMLKQEDLALLSQLLKT